MVSLRTFFYALCGFITTYLYSDGDAMASLVVFAILILLLDNGTRGLR